MVLLSLGCSWGILPGRGFVSGAAAAAALSGCLGGPRRVFYMNFTLF